MLDEKLNVDFGPVANRYYLLGHADHREYKGIIWPEATIEYSPSP